MNISQHQIELIQNLSLDENISIKLHNDLNLIINQIAANGEINFEWNQLVKLFAIKFHQISNKYYELYGFVGPVNQTFDQRLSELMTLVLRFDYPPFTIQRFAEVLNEENNQYKSTHKFFNCVEKLLLVTTNHKNSNNNNNNKEMVISSHYDKGEINIDESKHKEVHINNNDVNVNVFGLSDSECIGRCIVNSNTCSEIKSEEEM